MATQEQRFNPALGFYFKCGGKDIPIAYDPRARFGFNTDDYSGDPIYAYRINDIQDFLYNNTEYTNVLYNEDGTVSAIQNITIENAINVLPVYLQLSDFLFNTTGYRELFYVVDFVYMNQDDIVSNPNPNQRLIYLLERTKNPFSGKSLIDDFTDGFRNNISIGVDRELKRINYFYFWFDICFDNTVRRGPKEFVIYFNPHTMVEDYFDKNKYDITFTQQFSQFETDKLTNVLASRAMYQARLSTSISPVNLWSYAALESNRNYKSMDIFSTTFRVVSLDYKILDQYKRHFIIHSHLRTPLNEYEKINIVRDYIFNTVFPDGQKTDDKMAYLYLEYPDLFFKYTIDIYPYSAVGKLDNLKYTSIISMKQITDLLNRKGIVVPSQKSVEVFLVEGVGIHDDKTMDKKAPIPPREANKGLTMPLIAVCATEIPFYGPITDNFSAYAPSFAGGNYVDSMEMKFNFYIKTFLPLVLDIYHPSNEDIVYRRMSQSGIENIDMKRNPGTATYYDKDNKITVKEGYDMKDFLYRDDATDIKLAEIMRIPPEMNLKTERGVENGKRIFTMVSFILGNAIIRLRRLESDPNKVEA